MDHGATVESFKSQAEVPPALLVGCPECDLLLRLPPPAPGESAACPRCHYTLASGLRDGFRLPLAFAVAALVLMVIAASFPFLSLAAVGLENRMTLITAALSLTRFGADAVAILVMAFVLFVPGLMMAGVAALSLLLEARRPSRLLVPLARTLFHLDAWCMADVFAIGVIVSLVKLSAMADVVLGTAFWAYLGFAACFMVSVSSLDRLTVWSTIDQLREAR